MKNLLPKLSKVLILVVFIFSCYPLVAATITATSSGGDWNDGSTWVGGVVPGSGDDVVINSGCEVDVMSAASANSISITNGSLLVVSESLTVSDDITVDGTDSEMDGDATVSVTLSANTISIQNGAGMYLDDITVSVNGNVTVGTNGTLQFDRRKSGTIETVDLRISNGGRITTGSRWDGSLKTTGNFIIDAGGEFDYNGSGTVDFGNSVDDKFVSSGTVKLNSSTITVAGYMQLLAGQLSLAGTNIINVANAGVRNDTNDNLRISSNFDLYYGAASDVLIVVINNGNTGTGKEVNIESFTTSGAAGSVFFKFKNTSGVTHDYTFEIGGDGKLPSIDSDIGSGNTLNFISGSGIAIKDTMPCDTLRSGSFYQDSLMDLTVSGDFYSQSSDSLFFDGVLSVNGTLTLNGSANSVTGEGWVYAGNYDFGGTPKINGIQGEKGTASGASVFGVWPGSGRWAAGSTWVGDKSDDWFNRRNWGNNRVPSKRSSVFISSDYKDTYNPVINSSGAKAKEVKLEGSGIQLDVQSSGDLTVYKSWSFFGRNGRLTLETGTDLTVSGSVDVQNLTEINGGTNTINSGGSFTSKTITNTDNASLVVESTSSGDGSLICGGAPNATVQRYVDDDAWHLVTPVTDAVSTKDFYLGGPNRSWLTAFNESDDSYYYITNADSSLSIGTGFSYWIGSDQGAQTIDYTGHITGADVSVTLTKDDKGWNLIGNPFPSALDWSSVSAGNTTGTSYIWDNTQNGYLYSATGSGESTTVGTIPNDIIPMGQGFLVQANSAGSFTIPASARVHDHTNSFVKSAKKENAPNQYIRIDIDGGYYGNTVFVGFPKYGTDDFDIPGDATKLFSSGNHIQFYVAHKDEKLCIEANAPLLSDTNKVVPLDVVQATGKSYTMKFSELNQLPNVDITLEDLKTGVKQDIRKNPVYTFTAFKDDAPNRFLLHFSKEKVNGVGEKAMTSSGTQIYSYGPKIYIRTSGKDAYNEDVVFVYDLMGRKLLERRISDSGLTGLNIPVKDSYVVVKVVKNNRITTKKVFVE